MTARLFVASAVFLAVVSCGSAASALDEKTYNQPRWFDDRLDWCLNWSADCGKPAADNFCKRRRYTGASRFAAESGVGRTRVSGTNQICSGSFCTGFKYITCYGPVPTQRVFQNPEWKGYRLDMCLNWGTNCGKPAADAFCRSEGFTESTYSVPDPEPGRGSTCLIGTSQICDQKFCVGFQMITCR